jgi:hypothetical protein
VTRSWIAGHDACYVSHLASEFDDLPWTHLITFKAPAGRMRRLWNSWDGLQRLDRGHRRRRLERQPFWLFAAAWYPGRVVDHPFQDGARQILRSDDWHVHLCIGGVSEVLLYQMLYSWEDHGGTFDVKPMGVGKNTVWAALHYTIGGQVLERPLGKGDRPKQHFADVNSYNHALLDCPRYSANFEMLRVLTRRKIARTMAANRQRAGQRSASNLTPEQRSERSRNAARARWS